MGKENFERIGIRRNMFECEFIIPKCNQEKQIDESYSFTQSYIFKRQFDHISQTEKLWAYEWPNDYNFYERRYKFSAIDFPPRLGKFVGPVIIIEQRTAKPGEPTYTLGWGAGEGEEYSTIPGYEGYVGYHKLINDSLCINYLPDSFIHPQTGQLFSVVEWDGCEADSCGYYIIVNNPTIEEIQEALIKLNGEKDGI